MFLIAIKEKMEFFNHGTLIVVNSVNLVNISLKIILCWIQKYIENIFDEISSYSSNEENFIINICHMPKDL